MGNNVYEGTFLSAGVTGYRAPSPRKPDVKEIIQHMRRCWDKITRNVNMLQQAALEQELSPKRIVAVGRYLLDYHW